MEESKDKVEKTVSPLTTESVKGVSRIGTSSVGGGDMSTMDEALGQIFVILKRIDAFDRLQNEKQLADLQIQNLEEIDRNQKLIKALRGKPRRPKRKPPEEEKQQKEIDKAKTEQLPAAKPTVPEAPKPPTAKPAPTKPPEVTKPAAPTKSVEPTKPPAAAPQPASTAAPVKPAATQPATPTTAPVKPAAPKAATAAKVAIGAATAMSLTDVQAMIMEHEGKVNYPYKDSKGLWTIGVGHLIGNGKTLPPEYDAWKNNGGPYDKKNNKTPALTDKQVQELFDKDFEEHKKKASKSPGWDLANETGQAAMIDLTYNMGAWWTIFKQAAKAAAAGDFNKFADQLQYKNPETKELSGWYQQVGKRAVKITGMIRQGKNIDTNTIPENPLPPAAGGKIEQASKENRDLKADAANQESPPTRINNNTYNTQQASSPSGGGSSDDTNPYTRKQRG
jgi:GH24 family phage-related lysozyme (muramidase)